MDDCDKLRKYFQCVKCEVVPVNKAIYTCNEGHNICADCEDKNNKRCICGSIIKKNRNIMNEEFLKNFRPTSAPQVLETPSLQKEFAKEAQTELLFTNMNLDRPHRASGSIEHIIHKDASRSRELAHPRPTARYPVKQQAKMAPSSIHLSKRPIDCPNSDCDKLITLSSLILHFSFDHPKIPQQYVDLGEPKVLPISLTDLSYGRTTCLALLLVNSSKDSRVSLSPYSSDIAFPVLAAKILCKTQKNHNPKEFNTYDKSRHSKEKSREFEMIIIWLCGCNETLNCIIEATNIAKGISFSYTGPIVSLRNDNDPYSVFSKSDCLVLHSSSVDKLAFSDGEDEKVICEIKVILTKKTIAR